MKSITLFLSFLILSLTLHTPLVIAGTFNTTYVYDEKDLVARKDPDGKKFYYYPDHLGSTSVVVNETGSIVEETTYEPFGKVSSGGSDRFLYTGKELDQGTGLEYYGVR